MSLNGRKDNTFVHRVLIFGPGHGEQNFKVLNSLGPKHLRNPSRFPLPSKIIGESYCQDAANLLDQWS